MRAVPATAEGSCSQTRSQAAQASPHSSGSAPAPGVNCARHSSEPRQPRTLVRDGGAEDACCRTQTEFRQYKRRVTQGLRYWRCRAHCFRTKTVGCYVRVFLPPLMMPQWSGVRELAELSSSGAVHAATRHARRIAPAPPLREIATTLRAHRRFHSDNLTSCISTAAQHHTARRNPHPSPNIPVAGPWTYRQNGKS